MEAREGRTWSVKVIFLEPGVVPGTYMADCPQKNISLYIFLMVLLSLQNLSSLPISQLQKGHRWREWREKGTHPFQQPGRYNHPT